VLWHPRLGEVPWSRSQSEWANLAEARAAVFAYLEVFYNRMRHHSSLGNISLEQFEERYRSRPAVAAGRRVTVHETGATPEWTRLFVRESLRAAADISCA
jgi:hypothetical protein